MNHIVNEHNHRENTELASEVLTRIAISVLEKGLENHLDKTKTINIDFNGLHFVFGELVLLLSGDHTSADIKVMDSDSFIEQIFNGFDCDLYGYTPKELSADERSANDSRHY